MWFLERHILSRSQFGFCHNRFDLNPLDWTMALGVIEDHGTGLTSNTKVVFAGFFLRPKWDLRHYLVLPYVDTSNMARKPNKHTNALVKRNLPSARCSLYINDFATWFTRFKFKSITLYRGLDSVLFFWRIYSLSHRNVWMILIRKLYVLDIPSFIDDEPKSFFFFKIIGMIKDQLMPWRFTFPYQRSILRLISHFLLALETTHCGTSSRPPNQDSVDHSPS